MDLVLAYINNVRSSNFSDSILLPFSGIFCFRGVWKIERRWFGENSETTVTHLSRRQFDIIILAYFMHSCFEYSCIIPLESDCHLRVYLDWQV